RRRIRLDQVHQFLPRLRSSKWRRQTSCTERCGCKGSRRPQRLKPRYGLPGRSLRWFPIQRWQTLRVDSFCAFCLSFQYRFAPVTESQRVAEAPKSEGEHQGRSFRPPSAEVLKRISRIAAACRLVKQSSTSFQPRQYISALLRNNFSSQYHYGLRFI